jgi:hypothetical protein
MWKFAATSFFTNDRDGLRAVAGVYKSLARRTVAY